MPERRPSIQGTSGISTGNLDCKKAKFCATERKDASCGLCDRHAAPPFSDIISIPASPRNLHETRPVSLKTSVPSSYQRRAWPAMRRYWALRRKEPHCGGEVSNLPTTVTRLLIPRLVRFQNCTISAPGGFLPGCVESPETGVMKGNLKSP